MLKKDTNIDFIQGENNMIKKTPIIRVDGTRTGGIEVYLEFTLKMKPQWKSWIAIAKDRFVYHFERHHASDTYSGNVDFRVVATGWGGNKVWGDITLYVPSDYAKDWGKTKTEYVECAEDAIGNVIKYDLSRQEQELIDNVKVKMGD